MNQTLYLNLKLCRIGAFVLTQSRLGLILRKNAQIKTLELFYSNLMDNSLSKIFYFLVQFLYIYYISYICIILVIYVLY